MPRSTKKTVARPRATIYTGIRRSLPAARTVIEDGLHTFYQAIGDHFPKEPLSDQAMEEVNRWTDRTFELGIAVGLLLNRSILETAADRA